MEPSAMTMELSDAQLVGRCRNGEAAAWNELVERFSRYVYAIAVRVYRLPEHDAEDVFQEVFARVYERLGSLRDDGAIRPWLAQLTRNTCVDRLRASTREQTAEDLSAEEVGGALDLPAGTIASRISRCLGKLREQLEGRKSSPDPSGGS